MITLDQIRERLQESIRQSGMTQTEIAKRTGVIQQSIAQYMSGRALPALDTFANLCEVLDVDPAYILCLIKPGKEYNYNFDRTMDNINY